MKKRKGSSEGGANWMDTYGDLVTLLLCFFVLLYSISSIDQGKYANLVKSLNPEVEVVAPGFADIPSDANKDPTSGEQEANQEVEDAKFEEMYERLTELEEVLGEEVQVAKGDGYQFITFKNSVFFDGDRYVLKDEGKVLLDQFAEAIAPSADVIQELRVFGHTSQAEPDIPNEVLTDRTLAAMRTAVVVTYIQEKNLIDPGKLVQEAYGQFRPIDTFDTPEGRANNRRVEILITKNGEVQKSLEDYYNEVYGE